MQKESYYSIICDIIIDELILTDYLLWLDTTFLKWRQEWLVELARRLLYRNLEKPIEDIEDVEFQDALYQSMDYIIAQFEQSDMSDVFIKWLYAWFGSILLSIVNHYEADVFTIKGSSPNCKEMEDKGYMYIWRW